MANLKSLARRSRHGIALLSFVSLSACGLTLPKQTISPAPAQEKVASMLVGKIETPQGETVDLSRPETEIQVVMFVSETCSICRHETKGLVENLSVKGAPKNVRFYSVLIGSTPEDATDWRSDLKVPWTVALDPGDALFRQYCPSAQTPCVLLRGPGSDQIQRLYGEHSLGEWEALTGRWSY